MSFRDSVPRPTKAGCAEIPARAVVAVWDGFPGDTTCVSHKGSFFTIVSRRRPRGVGKSLASSSKRADSTFKTPRSWRLVSTTSGAPGHVVYHPIQMRPKLPGSGVCHISRHANPISQVYQAGGHGIRGGSAGPGGTHAAILV